MVCFILSNKADFISDLYSFISTDINMFLGVLLSKSVTSFSTLTIDTFLSIGMSLIYPVGEYNISIKYDVPNDKPEMFEDYKKAIDEFYDKVLQKNA